MAKVMHPQLGLPHSVQFRCALVQPALGDVALQERGSLAGGEDEIPVSREGGRQAMLSQVAGQVGEDDDLPLAAGRLRLCHLPCCVSWR